MPRQEPGRRAADRSSGVRARASGSRATRLGQDRPSRVAQEPLGLRVRRVPGQEDHPRRRRGHPSFEPLIERSARRPGHAQVQGDGVEHAALARQRAPGAFGVGDHGRVHAELLQEIAQHPRDVLLVVDDQHVAPTDPLRRRRRCGGPGHRRPVVRGKVDDERRAEAGTAFGGQAPSVTLHDAVADRQPEPRPLPNRLRREERLEDAGQGVGRESRVRCPRRPLAPVPRERGGERRYAPPGSPRAPARH